MDDVEDSLTTRLSRQHTHFTELGREWHRYESSPDLAIPAITETAARALAFERASVWFRDGDVLACKDQYLASHGKHSHATILSAGDYPDYFDALDHEEVIQAEDAHTDPRTGGLKDAYLKPNGIGAMLDAPIRAQGKTVGVLCLEHVGGPREFHADEVNAAQHLVNMITVALEFQRSRDNELAAQRSLSLLRAAVEASGVGIIAVDEVGNVTAYNENYLEMWHISRAMCEAGDPDALQRHLLEMTTDPEQFIARYESFKTEPEIEYVDESLLKDGRTIEIISHPQRLDEEIIGRVWTFRDISYRKELERELKERALRDPLTGLFNRRRAEEVLEYEVLRAKRDGLPLSVVYLDIDCFKAVNDTHGHDVGDAVLCELADDLSRCKRATDSACRWGGEEFLLVLPNTDLDGALHFADVLRASIDRERGALPAFTISAGVAAYDGSTGYDNMVAAADKKMYAAKQAGRNCVMPKSRTDII